MSTRSRMKRWEDARWWLLVLAVMIWPCALAMAGPQAEEDEPAAEAGESEPASDQGEPGVEEPAAQMSLVARTADERKGDIDKQMDAALANMDALLAEMDALLLSESKITAPSGGNDRTASRAASLAEAGGEPRIVLYETSWCGYCRKAQELLKQLDADFEVKDIERDRQAAAEFRRKSGGRAGVPLIDIGGEIVRGYDERRIRKLVAEQQQKGGARRD